MKPIYFIFPYNLLINRLRFMKENGIIISRCSAGRNTLDDRLEFTFYSVNPVEFREMEKIITTDMKEDEIYLILCNKTSQIADYIRKFFPDRDSLPPFRGIMAIDWDGEVRGFHGWIKQKGTHLYSPIEILKIVGHGITTYTQGDTGEKTFEDIIKEMENMLKNRQRRDEDDDHTEMRGNNKEIWGDSIENKNVYDIKASLIGAGEVSFIIIKKLLEIGIQNIDVIDDEKIKWKDIFLSPFYSEKDISKLKIDILKEKLKSINHGDVNINFFPFLFSTLGGLAPLRKSDFIISTLDEKNLKRLNYLSSIMIKPLLCIVEEVHSKEEKEISIEFFMPGEGCSECLTGKTFNTYKNEIYLKKSFLTDRLQYEKVETAVKCIKDFLQEQITSSMRIILRLDKDKNITKKKETYQGKKMDEKCFCNITGRGEKFISYIELFPEVIPKSE